MMRAETLPMTPDKINVSEHYLLVAIAQVIVNPKPSIAQVIVNPQL